ncbi:MAG: hypothetical protein AAFU81_00610 [Pseudomonadota bacterium]
MVLPIDQHLGARIAAARHALGRSEAEVAEAIEVSVVDYKSMEAGTIRIKAICMSRLSTELKQPLKWFYQGLPGQDAFDRIKLPD